MSTLSLYNKIFVHPQNMQYIPSLTSDNMDTFINKNDVKKIDTKVEPCDPEKLTDSNVYKAVVDAFCNQDVLSKVSQILKNKFIERTT